MADETKTKKAGEKAQKRPEKGSKKGKAGPMFGAGRVGVES